MQVNFSIEYFTVWGEMLVLILDDKEYKLEYQNNGRWGVSIGRLKVSGSHVYHYEVWRDGVLTRREWGNHTLVSHEDSPQAINVEDHWQDVPVYAPFLSGAFESGVLCGGKTPEELYIERWKSAGLAVPVFSLRSRGSFGVGDFRDLRLLCDLACKWNLHVIQLLPVNDTTMNLDWTDSYPYSANSIYALHPQFVCLSEAGVAENEEYLKTKAELESSPTVDYEKVNAAKDNLMRKAFKETWRKVSASAEYKAFVKDNNFWLEPYCAYRILRDIYGTPDFSKWGNARRATDAVVTTTLIKNRKEASYHSFVQFHLHRQLVTARDYARSKGIVFKGDLPIGVSRTSADAWSNPTLFHLDSQAGAPPDAFAAEGQNWGFPTYDWERMARDRYSWWKARLGNMEQYFDAFRIDHILGFFRIWEIPEDCVHGLLGHFNPALPYTAGELAKMGFDMSQGLYTTPLADDLTLEGIFGPLAEEVRRLYVKDRRLKPAYSMQRKVLAAFEGSKENKAFAPDQAEKVRDGLLKLIDDVLFVEDPRQKGMFHPRIAAQYTYAYARLDYGQKQAFNTLYNDFFYRRHNDFWKASALRKLPELLSSTKMLACGEDLGMIPSCVAQVMDEQKILSLEIQRMPKEDDKVFGDPSSYPYYSVCATSTHDMSPLRAWWHEDRKLTQRFYNEVLGRWGEAPQDSSPEICKSILEMNLHSPSMLAIFPLQDYLSIAPRYCSSIPEDERINVPAITPYYWRYRMSSTIEELSADSALASEISSMIKESGR